MPDVITKVISIFLPGLLTEPQNIYFFIFQEEASIHFFPNRKNLRYLFWFKSHTEVHTSSKVNA